MKSENRRPVRLTSLVLGQCLEVDQSGFTLFHHHLVITTAIQIGLLAAMRSQVFVLGTFHPGWALPGRAGPPLLAITNNTTLVGRRASMIDMLSVMRLARQPTSSSLVAGTL